MMRSEGIFKGRRDGCGARHGRHGGMGFGRAMRGEGMGAGREGRERGHGRRGGGRMFDHGALRWVLLSLIAEKPSHGYELIKDVEARFGGAYTPSPGVIYPTLTLLEEMGALESEARGGKKLYAITGAGRAMLTENDQVLRNAEARMNKFAAWAKRPAAIHDAIGRLRTTVHARLDSEAVLSEDQIKAIADILNDAAEKVEKT